MGQIADRQSLVFSERGQLSQAIPHVHVERILHQRTPIARFESQCNERRVYKDQILCFRGRYDRQQTLVIRIAAITLASDSVITLARFRPSKLSKGLLLSFFIFFFLSLSVHLSLRLFNSCTVLLLVATNHISPFTCCFHRFFRHSFTFFSATGTPNSQKHSFVHCSVSEFTGEWFTIHSNHIHIFTPITRTMATKVLLP